MLHGPIAHLNKMYVLPKANETVSKFGDFRTVCVFASVLRHECDVLPGSVHAETSDAFLAPRYSMWTGEHSQLVAMTVPAGGDIGKEVRCVAGSSDRGDT